MYFKHSRSTCRKTARFKSVTGSPVSEQDTDCRDTCTSIACRSITKDTQPHQSQSSGGVCVTPFVLKALYCLSKCNTITNQESHTSKQIMNRQRFETLPA